MPSLIERGIAWHAAKLTSTKVAGETLTYSRPSTAQSVPLTVTPGQSMLALDVGDGGTRIEWTDADFLIVAAELSLGGVAVEPQRKDRITRTKGGKTVVYEVLPYENEPCWRWADEHRTLMRVHTKEIAVS